MSMHTLNSRRGVTTPRQSSTPMGAPAEPPPSSSDLNETKRGWFGETTVVSVLRAVVRHITIF